MSPPGAAVGRVASDGYLPERAARGANALEVKKWLGHASVATTYDVYGHLLPDDVDDLATRMGQAVGAGAENVVPLVAAGTAAGIEG